MKRVLFVSNDASRTGAPNLLLWLIRWLSINTDLHCTAVLMRAGPLVQEFADICETHWWSDPKPQRWYKRITNKVFRRQEGVDHDAWLARIVNDVKPDCIYLNTLVLGKYLGKLDLTGEHPLIITHVHELRPSLQLLSSPEHVQLQLDSSSIVVAGVKCIEEMLLKDYGLDPRKCAYIHEFVPLSHETGVALHSSAESHPALQRLREESEKGTFIFGMAGSPINRKGFDLFPMLLRECAELFQGEPFLGVWIGCGEGSGAHAAIEWDLKRVGAWEKSVIVPPTSLHIFGQLLSQFKVLSLLSREDPFPLVALEAGARHIPTVCFKSSGGAPELAAEGCCIAVDFLDLKQFASAIYQLSRDPQSATEMADRFQAKVFSEMSIDSSAPKIAALLKSDQ